MKPSQKTLPWPGSGPTSKARPASANLFCFQNMAVCQAWVRAGHNPSCWPLHAKLTNSPLSLFHMTMPQTLGPIWTYYQMFIICPGLWYLWAPPKSPYSPGEVSSHRGLSWTKHLDNSSWKASQSICVHLIDQTHVGSLLRGGDQAA